jgi:hypothetical protein
MATNVSSGRRTVASFESKPLLVLLMPLEEKKGELPVVSELDVSGCNTDKGEANKLSTSGFNVVRFHHDAGSPGEERILG